MTSTASPILRLELMGSGDQPGSWGSTTNTNLGTLLEGSIAGVSNVSVTSANQALTALNYATDQSRMAILILTTTTAANFAVYAPGNNTLTPSPLSKTYAIYNNTAYTATIYNSTSTGNTTAAGAGVTLAAGEKAYVFSDGKNFYKAVPSSFSLSLGTAAAPSLSFVSDADTGIYSSGANQVSVATSGARIANFTTSTLDLYTTDVTYGPQVTLNSIHSAVPGPYFIANKARNNGSGSAAIVQSGDTLGVLSFNGYDGTAYRNAVQIAASVDTTPGANDMPGRLSIYVTPDGSTTPAERLTIINSGFVGIGTSAPVNRLDVNGRGAFTQDAAASNGAVILRQNSGDTIGAYIQWVNNAASAEKGWITVDTSSNMKFATGSTLRLTIDSSGNATFTGSVTASGGFGGNVSAGNYYQGLIGGSRSPFVVSPSITKIVEVRVFCTGTIRVQWIMVPDSNGYSRVYVNGTAVGAMQNASSQVTLTSDVSVTAGDLVQIWGYDAGGSYSTVYIYGPRIGTASVPFFNITSGQPFAYIYPTGGYGPSAIYSGADVSGFTA